MISNAPDPNWKIVTAGATSELKAPAAAAPDAAPALEQFFTQPAEFTPIAEPSPTRAIDIDIFDVPALQDVPAAIRYLTICGDQMGSESHWKYGSGVGSESQWKYGSGVGSESQWKYGSGPGSEAQWKYGSGAGSEAQWKYGSGPGSEAQWKYGSGPGSEAQWNYGSGPGSKSNWEYGS